MKQDKKRIIIEAIGGALVLFIAICIAIWAIQPSLFFYPWHDSAKFSALMNDDNFTNITVESGEYTLNGWYKASDADNAPLLIFFGGNAMNSSNMCYKFSVNNTYAYFGDYAFLTVDYPGYGLSKGKPSDENMLQAALDIYDYALTLDNINTNKIVIMGFSIGTSPATYLASQRDVNGLILLAPFDNALSLYNSRLDIFHGPMKLLARYEFDSIKYAQDVKTKPLVIASKADESIPYGLSGRLQQSFAQKEDMVILDNLQHNDIIMNGKALKAIQEYLEIR